MIFSRCFPKSRGDLELFLKDHYIDNYDPLCIIEKTKGRCTEDNMHISFSRMKIIRLDYEKLVPPQNSSSKGEEYTFSADEEVWVYVLMMGF